jgi:hypothetical protein
MSGSVDFYILVEAFLVFVLLTALVVWWRAS